MADVARADYELVDLSRLSFSQQRRLLTAIYPLYELSFPDPSERESVLSWQEALNQPVCATTHSGLPAYEMVGVIAGRDLEGENPEIFGFGFSCISYPSCVAEGTFLAADRSKGIKGIGKAITDFRLAQTQARVRSRGETLKAFVIECQDPTAAQHISSMNPDDRLRYFKAIGYHQLPLHHGFVFCNGKKDRGYLYLAHPLPGEEFDEVVASKHVLAMLRDHAGIFGHRSSADVDFLCLAAQVARLEFAHPWYHAASPSRNRNLPIFTGTKRVPAFAFQQLER